MLRKNLGLINFALLNSFIVTIVFAVIYPFYNIEFVRNSIEDSGFDIVNQFFISTNVEKVQNAPKILVYSFDDVYMKENNLFDKDNNTNYGYIFPRTHIVKFIKELDVISNRLEKRSQKAPKALFVDLDLSFTSMTGEKTVSKDDQQLLDILKKERSYTIVLPKTRTANFVEHSNDSKIISLIDKQKIIFGSVGFKVSNDYAIRRYKAYKTFHNQNDTNNTYLNANIILWKLFKNEDINTTKLQQTFFKEDIISNRILIKKYQKVLNTRSNWENYNKYSVTRHFVGSVDEEYADAIVMLGSTFTNNNDSYEVLNVWRKTDMFGVELHANVLMTLFYFDGQLKQLSLLKTLFLVFCLVFIISLFVSIVLRIFNFVESKWVLFGVLGLSLVAMMYCSLALLKLGVWLNWFTPIVLFKLINSIM